MPRVVVAVAALAAMVAIVCIVYLIGDHVVTGRRAAAELARVEALVEEIKTDAGVAAELAEERKRRTDRSLEREGRNHRVGWVLLIAGGSFFACGKWLAVQRPAPSPALDELIQVRFGQAPSTAGQPSTAPGEEPEAGDEPELDLCFVDELVGRLGRSREMAVPLLQAIQGHYRYLPDEALQRVTELTEISPAQIAGTSSFYSQLRRSPVGRHVVRICHGTACHVAGAELITGELRRHLAIPDGADTDRDRRFTLDAVACLGCCSLAPVMMIGDDTAGRLTVATARQALAALEAGT